MWECIHGHLNYDHVFLCQKCFFEGRKNINGVSGRKKE
jgi:hypothetical protein